VTQPRVTCYRVGIRMNEPQMPALLVSHGRPGFYFRVLEEGQVGAGDEISKVKAGPEQMTVAEILAGSPEERVGTSVAHPGIERRLENFVRRAARPGTERRRNNRQPRPRAIGGPAGGMARDFRPLRVSQKMRESSNVTSLVLEPVDGQPLTAALAGQFIVLRLRPSPDAPVLLRSYSLSGEPSAERYRISVKREPHGAAGTYIDTRVQAGNFLEVSAPRGSFTLQQGDGPVVLVGAGIGATPVLAMLYALAAGRSPREVWWIHGARNSSEHPFAAEARMLLRVLRAGRSQICYSAPRSSDRPAVDFDRVGHVDAHLFDERGIPRDADFYICGPAAFMTGLVADLTGRGVAPDRLHTENFGSGPSMTPGGRRGPAATAASAGGSLIIRHWAACILYAQQSHCPLGFRIPQPARARRGLRRAARWSCRTGVCHNCETGLI
jgi:ferredoxin-NADP reductase